MKNISCNQKYVLDIVKLVLACLSLMVLLWVGKWVVRIFWFDTFIIPSCSMMPTLQPGDKIIADKLCFGARIYRDFHFDKKGVELQCFRMKGMGELRRNDVFVFNMPIHNQHIAFVLNYVYCKRCIGLPGDSVSIRNGYYLNNNFAGNLGCVDNQMRLSKTPDKLISPDVMCTMPYDNHLPKWTIKNFGPLYLPRKGDVITITPQEAELYKYPLEWELKGKISINWQRNQVLVNHKPLTRHTFLHDYYFAGGDNVVDSHDSRYWGLVPDIYIIGIVKRIEYSKARVTGKYDWRRFLRCVK